MTTQQAKEFADAITEEEFFEALKELTPLCKKLLDKGVKFKAWPEALQQEAFGRLGYKPKTFYVACS